MIIYSAEGDLLNTKPLDPYFQMVKRFIINWESKPSHLMVKTSGSTGKPKEIKLSREQILASVNQTKEAFNLNDKTIFVCSLSIEFIAGKLMIIRALELNAEVIILQPAEDFMSQLSSQIPHLEKNYGNNFFAFVPLQIQKLLDNPEAIRLLNTARATLIGGASVSIPLYDKIQQIRSAVYATYGMTETVTHVAIRKLNGENASAYFTPLPDIKISKGPQSIIEISGPTTRNETIITNDIAEFLPNGSFKILGRVDNVINSGGVKLFLEDIERKLSILLPPDTVYFCTGKPDRKWGEKLTLFIEGEEKDKNLFQYLKVELPKFEAPKEIIYLPKFNYTPGGKIDKKKTLHEYAENSIPN